MGNLIQGFFGGGAPGASANAKPISTNNSGTLNTASGKIRATRYEGAEIAKVRKAFADKVGDFRVIETVKDKKTGEITTRTKIIKKNRLAEIADRINKSHAGERMSSLKNKMIKKHEIDYKDKDGKVITVKFGSTSRDIEKRKKFIAVYTDSDGPSKRDIEHQQKIGEGRKRANIYYISSQREKADELAKSRQKPNKDSRQENRMNKAKVSSSGYKTSMSDIGIVNTQALESTVGVNVEKAQGQGAAAAVEHGQGAASIAASIGTKAEALKSQEAKIGNERLAQDPFEKVAGMGKKGGYNNPEVESFFKDKAADDHEIKKAA